MMKRPRSNKVRGMIGSYKGRRRWGHAGAWNVRENGEYLPVLTEGVKVFVGPSVEGGDAEYVLIASGKVSQKKPSFAK